MDPEAREAMRTVGRVSAVGMELGGAVIGSLLLGWWADSKLGTSPWLTLLGLLIGSIAGFKAVYSAAKLMQKQAESETETPPSNEGDP